MKKYMITYMDDRSEIATCGDRGSLGPGPGSSNIISLWDPESLGSVYELVASWPLANIRKYERIRD